MTVDLIKSIKDCYTVDKEVSKMRLETCMNCDKIKYLKFIDKHQCSKCGCIVEFKVKMKSKCPLGKW